MPIFHLKPVVATLADGVWEASLHRGDAWVNAPDEAEARGLAAGKLDRAELSRPGEAAAASPWQSAALVDAHEVASGPNGMVIPNGTVVYD